MLRRLTLALLLLFGVLASAAPTRAAAPRQSEPPGLELVRSAYGDLLDLFFRKPDPRELLSAGWSAVAPGVRAADPDAPASLGALPADRDAAFAVFGAVYREEIGRGKLPASLRPPNLAFAIADGMARSLHEQHTNFLPPAVHRSVLSSLGAGDLPVGVGMRWTAVPPYIVTAVAPDGPAARADVQVGDVIATIDGSPTGQRALLMLQFPQLFNLPTGKATSFGLDRDGQRLERSVPPGPYYFPPLESRLLPGGAGYLRLDQFVQSSAPLADGKLLLPELDRRLDELDAQGVRALVLDLRGNSGGSGATAKELLGRFLPEDALTGIEFDERGHEATAIVSGQMRRLQLPLVVLVDGKSASASEIVASTLREENRALLVGQRTAGALAGSLILPLPEDAGLQVAIEEEITARSRTKIDGVGYPVDQGVPDTRSAADYRAGRDPQLDAAIAAIPRAPAPPTFHATTSGLSPERIRALLAGYAPDAGQIPTNDRLTHVTATGSRDLNHPNQAIGGSRDPLARRQKLRDRGWLGSHVQTYGANPFLPPSVSVSMTLYATPEGAAQSVADDDAADSVEPVEPPLQLGERTAAYRGTGLQRGTSLLLWRRGNAVFGVSYFDVPGFERNEIIVAVARLVDQAFQQKPLPQPAVGQVPAVATAPAAPDNPPPAVAAAPTDVPATAAAPEAAAPARDHRAGGWYWGPAVLVTVALVLAVVVAGIVIARNRGRPGTRP